MKYIKTFESYWEKAAKKSQQKKQKKENWLNTMKSKYKGLWDYLGKIVYYKGEYGIVIVKDNVLCIRWDTNKKEDYERLDGGNWTPEIVTKEHTFKWINMDGTLKDSL